MTKIETRSAGCEEFVFDEYKRFQEAPDNIGRIQDDITSEEIRTIGGMLLEKAPADRSDEDLRYAIAIADNRLERGSLDVSERDLFLSAFLRQARETMGKLGAQPNSLNLY